MAFTTDHSTNQDGVIVAEEANAALAVVANRTRTTDFGMPCRLNRIEVGYSDGDARTTVVALVRDLGLASESRVDLYRSAAPETTQKFHFSDFNEALTERDEVVVSTDDATGTWTVVAAATVGRGL